MDNYLEKLVLKESTESAESSSTDSTVSVVEQLDSVSTETDTEQSLAEDVVEDNCAQEPVESAQDVCDSNKTSDTPESSSDDIAAVKNIRIFNRPDLKSPFKIFSGNVILVAEAKVGSMNLIEYMKPGIGLVKGFTPDL